MSTASYIAYLFLQKNYLHKSGRYFLIAGFFCHSVLIGYGCAKSGHLPVYNLHETLLLTGWAIAGVFLVFQHKFNLRVLGIYAAPLVTIVTVVSSQAPADSVQAKNILNSIWLVFHVILIFIGYASFTLACGTGILYLVQEHAIKAKKRGFFFKRLPSLNLLDTTGYSFIASGFALLTIGLISGFIYAKFAWGKFWSWDPKEVWAGIMWLFYAVLLHERLVVGWRGRKAAIMSIIGFAVLLFTFFGVNFLLKGHHGDFTKW
ncbi:MAG: c-type cytochrome biogenesis protein CcsB [Lentisphaerae bacterium]|nr:c-type cytochrome biogenesis protein CcsB [Lentisphaerota bacterium]